MDRNILRANNEEDFNTLQEAIERFVSGKGLQGVTDDKTIVGIINTEIIPQLMADDYYSEPDWDRLKARMDQRLRSGKVPKAETAEDDTKEQIQASETETQHDTSGIQKAQHDKEALRKLEARCERLKTKNKMLIIIAAAELAMIMILTICLCVCLIGKSSDKKDSSKSSAALVDFGSSEIKEDIYDRLQPIASEKI